MRALGLRDGIAFPQLIVTDDGRALVVEVAARIPGGQMADLAFHALGVDLVEIALRQALGEEVPDELVVPRISRPTRDPLPDRAARAAADRQGASGSAALDRVLARPGSSRPTSYLQVGETIRPVRLDGDRRGYVIAVGETQRAGARARRGGRAGCSYVETE